MKKILTLIVAAVAMTFLMGIDSCEKPKTKVEKAEKKTEKKVEAKSDSKTDKAVEAKSDSKTDMSDSKTDK